jgi:hypothetical protein
MSELGERVAVAASFPFVITKNISSKKCDTPTLLTLYLCWCVQCDQGCQIELCVIVSPQWTGSAVREEQILF